MQAAASFVASLRVRGAVGGPALLQVPVSWGLAGTKDRTWHGALGERRSRGGVVPTFCASCRRLVNSMSLLTSQCTVRYEPLVSL